MRVCQIRRPFDRRCPKRRERVASPSKLCDKVAELAWGRAPKLRGLCRPGDHRGAYFQGLPVIRHIVTPLLVVLLSWAPASAAAYFVDKAGNDRNTGILGQPWLTIQKALNTVAPGDIVNVGAGTFYERLSPKTSGTSNSRITFNGTTDDSGNSLTIVDGSSAISGTW